MSNPPHLGDGVLDESIKVVGRWRCNFVVTGPELPAFLKDVMVHRFGNGSVHGGDCQLMPAGFG